MAGEPGATPRLAWPARFGWLVAAGLGAAMAVDGADFALTRGVQHAGGRAAGVLALAGVVQAGAAVGAAIGVGPRRRWAVAVAFVAGVAAYLVWILDFLTTAGQFG